MGKITVDNKVYDSDSNWMSIYNILSLDMKNVTVVRKNDLYPINLIRPNKIFDYDYIIIPVQHNTLKFEVRQSPGYPPDYTAYGFDCRSVEGCSYLGVDAPELDFNELYFSQLPVRFPVSPTFYIVCIPVRCLWETDMWEQTKVTLRRWEVFSIEDFYGIGLSVADDEGLLPENNVIIGQPVDVPLPVYDVGGMQDNVSQEEQETIQDLRERLNGEIQHNNELMHENDRLKERLFRLKERFDLAMSRIRDLEQELPACREKLHNAEKYRDELSKRYFQLRVEHSNLKEQFNIP